MNVYTLVIELGRKTGDGLPKGATGASLMCYAAGATEAEAVGETVAILKQADMAPLDVTGYGTLQERLAEGHEIDDEERALMDRALAENAVIIAQMQPFYDTPDQRARDRETQADPDVETGNSADGSDTQDAPRRRPATGAARTGRPATKG